LLTMMFADRKATPYADDCEFGPPACTFAAVLHPSLLPSEELLYALSGTAEHVVGNERVTLRAGVPIGVSHQAFVKGTQPFRISYSSGDRKVAIYGKTEE
jgi:hypothetical protein